MQNSVGAMTCNNVSLVCACYCVAKDTNLVGVLISLKRLLELVVLKGEEFGLLKEWMGYGM